MSDFTDKLVLFNSDTLGGGDPGLGSKMMRGFLKMLTKQKAKPRTLFFLGDSVKLLIHGSPVVEYMEQLLREGVEVLACRAAMEWYELEDQLAVGKISSTGILLQRMAELEVINL